MIYTGDSLLELVVITFETAMFFGRGFLLEDAEAAFSASSSSWSIIVIKFFSSLPRSPKIGQQIYVNICRI